MIEISGPDNQPFPVVDPATGRKVRGEKRIFFLGEILRDAVEHYCRTFGSRIAPYDGKVPEVPLAHGEQKYFYYYPKDGERTLIDIHLHMKDGSQTCSGQELDVPLEGVRLVSLGALIC